MLGEALFNLNVLPLFIKVAMSVYLNLVVLPQGVRGYFIDFVRPPCGWSIGFIATPRTIDLKPNDLQ